MKLTKIKRKLKFKALEKLNKITKPQLSAVATIYKNEKEIDKFYCESLTGGFMQQLYLHLNDGNSAFADNDSNNSTSGTNNNQFINTSNSWVTTTSINLTLDSPIGGSGSYGIFGTVVGSGSTAVAPSDYALETLIDHGSGAGELNYGVQQGTVGVTTVGTETYFILQRLFTNNSGSPIDINEFGIYGGDSVNQCMFLRDTMATVTLEDAETLNVQIKFSITT
jgi:hypothetical protein